MAISNLLDCNLGPCCSAKLASFCKPFCPWSIFGLATCAGFKQCTAPSRMSVHQVLLLRPLPPAAQGYSFQMLAAKLGVATGAHLAQHCR